MKKGSCDVYRMMRVAREYVRLGTAVQTQVDLVLANGVSIMDDLVDCGELNPNAMKSAKFFWKVFDQAVDEDEAMWPDIEKWLAERDVEN